MRRLYPVTFLLLFLGRLAIAQEKEELSALEIFDRTLKAFDNQRVALRDYQYYQTLTTHQFDSSGNIFRPGFRGVAPVLEGGRNSPAAVTRLRARFRGGVRLRKGPFEGPAIGKPPALPEDSYSKVWCSAR